MTGHEREQPIPDVTPAQPIDMVSLRTDNLSLVWRVREQDSRRIVAGIEERLGKKVERISEPK